MSILSDAKNLYHFFYNGKYWSEEKATNFFIDKDNSSARAQVVKTIYSVIFRSNKIDNLVKEWVRDKDVTLATLARLNNISEMSMNNKQNYVNRTLENELSIELNGSKCNILFAMVYKDNLSTDIWEEISAKIKLIRIKRAKEMSNVKPLMQNKDLLINIPSRAFNTEVEEDEWIQFINLIRPYFISERRKVQQRVNEEFIYSAGYVNYLMTPGMKFSEEDKRRYRQLESILTQDDNECDAIDKVNRTRPEKDIVDIIAKEEQEKINRIEDEKEREQKEIENKRKKALEDIEKGKNVAMTTNRVQIKFD